MTDENNGDGHSDGGLGGGGYKMDSRGDLNFKIISHGDGVLKLTDMAVIKLTDRAVMVIALTIVALNRSIV